MAKRRKRFLTWCNEDPTDDRYIHYTVHMDGETIYCDSDTELPVYTKENVITMGWLRDYAMVDSVQLIDNEWYVELSE